MILYLDTSALVKLLVQEAHSERVREVAMRSSVIATHLITYAEACAAFARYARFRRDKTLFQRLRRTLDRHWRQWDIVAADETLVRRAGELAGRYGLRGYDSVHLAAVEAVREASQGAEFLFGVFDADLAHAARLAGFSLLDY